ncbi:MAG: septum site-determining protein [Candidatus Melainabacteria bacterium RIFOXYA12_FULL_32_12]|nr:MAG: septum site-determining protein [Candidatus Melainabacteria bacterium RIFOXYA12_FULL_32_12]
MKDKTFLMIPGPTPTPESALLAMAKHPIGHRSPEFSAILKEVFQDLKWLFQTKEDVFVYTSSGTGAMEAAIYNLVNPGDKVLCLIIGNFGERWAKIAASKGAIVEKIEVEWGKAIDPVVLKKRLDEDVNKEIKIVTLTHNETSTGVTNDVKTLNDIIQTHGALSVVDGITSIGAIEFKMDEWGADVIVSGSQKGFMIPPGLAFLACSQKAWKVYEQCKYPSFYFNFGAYKKNAQDDTTPYTPAVSLIIALRETLNMMKQEGLDNIYLRHARLAKGLRSAIKAIGLKLFVEDDEIASNAITAILPPEGISVADIRKTLKNDFDIVVADGQGQLKGKIFRMGHLGFVSERDMIASVGALEMSLYKLGYKFKKGAGTEALITTMMQM